MSQDWIAITGGCGYVGSHVAATIKCSTDYKTLVIDNRASVLRHALAHADMMVEADYSSDLCFETLDRLRPLAIVHCAGSSLVGPSMSDPSKYYGNNVAAMVRLLDHMVDAGHENIIFSSSSSVYDDDGTGQPCSEMDTVGPISPYGTTKMIGEFMLRDYSNAYGLNCIAFRYFNAVGADPRFGLGQEPGATHIIARLMECLLHGTPFHIYGTDYETGDGTCIRDYVHVSDIAEAHVASIGYLLENPGNHVYNIGSGRGYSVREIIEAVEQESGRRIEVVEVERRQGDSSHRLADTRLIRDHLGWKPTRPLDQIVKDALQWYNSDTYGSLSKAA